MPNRPFMKASRQDANLNCSYHQAPYVRKLADEHYFKNFSPGRLQRRPPEELVSGSWACCRLRRRVRGKGDRVLKSIGLGFTCQTDVPIATSRLQGSGMRDCRVKKSQIEAGNG